MAASTMDGANKRGSLMRRQNAVKRHSASVGDGFDVQLIGKFESNAQSPVNGGFQDAVKPKSAGRGLAPGLMGDDGSPVVAELRTNVIIKDEFTLLTDISQLLAEQYDKPTTSIMISLQHSTCLTLGGMSDPCYLLNVTSVPSRKLFIDNRRVAQKVQWFLADILGVAAGRGIILFHPLPAQNVAFQGAQELKREVGESTMDARRRSGNPSWLVLEPEAHEDVVNDDQPLQETLAALQGVRAQPNSVRDDRRKTIAEPLSLSKPTAASLTVPEASSLMKERRKTLNVPPNLPTIPSSARADMSWSQLKERRRSLPAAVPPMPTIPSPSMMPADFGLAMLGPEDERPSTSHGRQADDRKPRLDDRSQTKAFAAQNGKLARPKSVSAEMWSYQQQSRESQVQANGVARRPQSSGGERGRPVDWRVSQLLSPPTLHHPARTPSTKSTSAFSDSSDEPSRRLSLKSVNFLSSLKSAKSPPSPQSPRSPIEQRQVVHNLEGVVIPPVHKSAPMPQRPHDQMRKRRSFVTALPQVESIPEVPPVPKMPEPEVDVEDVPIVDDAPLRKRKSLFKMSFKRSTAKV